MKIASKNINRLDIALVALALLAYALYLTGDYFLPVKSPLWLGGIVGLLGFGIATRLYLTYRPTTTTVKAILAVYWPVVVLVVALGLGGVLRYQSLKNSPPLSATDTGFINEAIALLSTNNWQPKSFAQPPLYLYAAAGMGELNFVQLSGAGKISTPEALTPPPVADLLRYLNFALGLFALIPVYAAGVKLTASRRFGAIAALLLATSWLAYQATNALLPQTLGATLAVSALYFLLRTNSKWDIWWGGFLVGVATAATYGAVLMLLPLLLIAIRRRTRLVRGLLGALLGFTLFAPSWILNITSFLNGLGTIGKAPEDTGKFYLKTALAHDPVLLGLFALAFVLVFWLRGKERFGLWLVLAFPLAYAVILNLFGPTLIERVALVVPFLALAAAFPLNYALDKAIVLVKARSNAEKAP